MICKYNNLAGAMSNADIGFALEVLIANVAVHPLYRAGPFLGTMTSSKLSLALPSQAGSVIWLSGSKCTLSKLKAQFV
jgi:hypothetical protein